MGATDSITPATGSPFWRFSLRFYRAPAVAEACIALQEEAGVDVNLLLFLLWHAGQRRQLSQAEVAGIESRIAGWRETAVVPLRTLRRALKSPPVLIAPAAAEAFRLRIKAVELEAERLQQEAMFEFAGPALLGREVSSPMQAARGNVASYETVVAAAFPKAAVDALMAGFDAMPKPEE
jgi:uncharacterized protein (TIGR02444 family)